MGVKEEDEEEAPKVNKEKVVSYGQPRPDPPHRSLSSSASTFFPLVDTPKPAKEKFKNKDIKKEKEEKKENKSDVDNPQMRKRPKVSLSGTMGKP